jgi:hypothetical protein
MTALNIEEHLPASVSWLFRVIGSYSASQVATSSSLALISTSALRDSDFHNFDVLS